jgi:methyl-accepting chemotaxis protein
MNAEHQTSPTTGRQWFGMGMLVVLILTGGVMLEVTSDGAEEEWFIRAWLVLGVALSVAYLLVVSLPRRRLERAYQTLGRIHSDQCAAISGSLEEMRHGDLVRCLEPAAELPRELAAEVDAAANSISALIQQIQGSSVDVATSAGTVHSTSAELAEGASQQAAAVVEITATTEQLARTAGQIATNAVAQEEFAVQAKEAGNAGARSLEQAVEGIGRLRRGIEVIADRADTLGTRSREIYRVLDLTTEIAQETHILALNAAIEASAAGQHGERFGVVAEEVRRLAERSRESVESVRGLLDDFSGGIRSVIVATEDGVKAADRMLEQSRAAQRAIEQLRGALDETARAASEISLTTDDQRDASNQVVHTLRDISTLIQQTAEGLGRFTTSAERLDDLALSIQLLTQSFRTDSVHSLKHQAHRWGLGLIDSAANLGAVEGVLADILHDFPYVELAYLVDTSGTMVAFELNREVVVDRQRRGAVAVGQSYGDRPWFQAVSRDRRAVVTPPYLSLLTDDRCFTIAAAIHDRSGHMIGTLGVDINVRSWTRI